MEASVEASGLAGLAGVAKQQCTKFIVKYKSKCCDRAFRCRVAVVTSTLTGKTHKLGERARHELTPSTPHQSSREAARNPHCKHCLGNMMNAHTHT